MALLQAIDDTGSISAGARSIGLSYKAAWDAVDAMNNLAGDLLVERNTGGKRGGGARLTQRAKQLLKLYQHINKAHQAFLQEIAQLAEMQSPDLDILRHFTMQTSARNKLRATLLSIDHGEGHDILHCRVGNKTPIIAKVPQASTQELMLSPGKHILLFINASAIMLGRHSDTHNLSARNQLSGRISMIEPDQSLAELTLMLEPGITLKVSVTMDSIQALALQEEDRVTLLFKASSVMVGRLP